MPEMLGCSLAVAVDGDARVPFVEEFGRLPVRGGAKSGAAASKLDDVASGSWLLLRSSRTESPSTLGWVDDA